MIFVKYATNNINYIVKALNSNYKLCNTILKSVINLRFNNRQTLHTIRNHLCCNSFIEMRGVFYG